jgi:hypothetical protein
MIYTLSTIYIIIENILFIYYKAAPTIYFIMNLDIKIQKIRTISSYLSSPPNPPDSSNYIYIHKYKYKNYFLSYKYINKYKFSIEFNIINDRIKYNYCYLFDKQKHRIEFLNTGSNDICKTIERGNRYYSYVYSVTYKLIKTTYNVYSLYKYFLSLKYLYKYNNMLKNISKAKKFNCMKNYKIIIYIAAAAK